MHMNVMKNEEAYFSDLRSLKENISNKIMEAIQDLEAKNLRKIEKKIEKASQKIALGLIKATLKKAEQLSKTLGQDFPPLTQSKKLKELRFDLISKKSRNEKARSLTQKSLLKTSLKGKDNPLNLPRKRGRPSKASQILLKEANQRILKKDENKSALGSDLPKKKGRPKSSKINPVLNKSSSLEKGDSEELNGKDLSSNEG